MAVLASGMLGGSGSLLHPAKAHADADPASDVLPLQNVYYPYKPQVSAKVQAQLNALTAAAKSAGYPIKVALIATNIDMGGIPQLFGKPQPYAKFLGGEISFNSKQPLLVVMPQGYGTSNAGPRAQAIADQVKIPSDAASKPDGLAAAAILAIPKLAAAAGHHVAAVKPVTGSGGGKSSTPAWVFIIPVVLLAIGGLFAARRRYEHDEPAGEEGAA
jgi:hypothetical protein